MKYLICLIYSLSLLACASAKPIEVMAPVKPEPTRAEMIKALTDHQQQQVDASYTQGYNDGYMLGFKNGNNSWYGTNPELPPGPRK